MPTLAAQIKEDMATLAAATDELAEACQYVAPDGQQTAVGAFWAEAQALAVSAPGLGVERHQDRLTATLSRAQLADCQPGARLIRPDGSTWAIDQVFPIGGHAWQAHCSQPDQRTLAPGRLR